VLTQGGFDFAQFNSETPDFDLLVNATEEFDVAIGQVPDEIAGFVKPITPIGPEGIGNKSALGQIRTMDIAAHRIFDANE
jgi:hypothetical protein